jgi:outer membrane receptor for ferrienterochelin and colicin
MKTKVVAVLLSLLSTPAFAVDPFISLTRTSSSLENMPTNVSVITQGDIEKMGATTLSDIINTVPGVKTESAGSVGGFATVKVRGVPSSNQVQVLIDDQPLGGVSIENIDIGALPVEDIERIEVVRGGASSLYGPNTIGGVIHIITKKTTDNTPLTGKIGYEGRSFQTHVQTNEVQASNGTFRGYVLGRRFDTQGYQDNSDAVNSHVSASVGATFADDMRVDLDYSSTQQEQGTPSGTPVAFKDWNGDRERRANTPTDRIDKNLERERLKLIIPFSHLMVQSVGHNFVDRRDFDSGFPSVSRNTIAGNDTRFIFDFGLTVGGSYERDERHSNDQAAHHITSVGSYVQQELHMSKLILIPAIRWDQHSKFGNEYNPRLSAVLNASDALKFSANAARAVRSPTLTDLFENFPSSFDPVYDFNSNPNLKPEVALTYDAGVEVKPNDSFSTSVTGFYTRIKDRIVTVDTDGALDFFGFTTNDSLANISKAEIAGAETEFVLRTGPVTNRINWTYQRAKGTSVASTKFVDLRLTPRHIINYELSFGLWKQATLINTAQFVSHQFASDDRQGAYVPPQRVWNIRLNQNVGEKVALFVGVDNVTDELYAQSVNFGAPVPMPTRTFKGGASVTFR